MESIKSDDVSRYVQMLKSGVLLEGKYLQNVFILHQLKNLFKNLHQRAQEQALSESNFQIVREVEMILVEEDLL